MAYRNTLQADALKLVVQKLQSSLAVEGELPEDGLAAYGDDGDDQMLALARKIVAGEEDAGSIESVFKEARQVAAEAEALLVDEGWHAPEPEPVAAEVANARAVGGAADAEAPERCRQPGRLSRRGRSVTSGRGRDEMRSAGHGVPCPGHLYELFVAVGRSPRHATAHGAVNAIAPPGPCRRVDRCARRAPPGATRPDPARPAWACGSRRAGR